MDALTELIAGNLRRRNMPVNQSLLAERIARLACRVPTRLDVLACNGEMIFIKVSDAIQQVSLESGEIIATVPCMPQLELDKSAELHSAGAVLTEGARVMDKDRADEEKKARIERRETLREAIARAQKEIQHFRDPANSTPPRFEREGDSWSLSL